MSAVTFEGVSKIYRVGFLGRKVQALHPMSLEVREGEVFGIIGPNGAGKSTAIKILLNLVIPTTGRALIFNRDVREPEARKGLGFVPEAPVPYEHLTGREYLELQAGLIGLSALDSRAEVTRALERVDMMRAEKLAIRRYSKGMTQRIMLAGAILGHPRMVILDEPTSGLDPLGRRLVRDLILELRRAGTSIIFCTHIMSDVETLSDRVALLIAGRVHKSGPVAELISTSRTHEVLVEAAQLSAIEGVLSAEDTVTREALPASVLLQVEAARLQSVLAKLVGANLKVARIQPQRVPLEDTFMEALRVTNQLGSIE